MSVFISWAGKDREVKNVLTAKLKTERILFWESDEYCIHDFSEECISNIRRSQIFVVIVSDSSMSPESYVINELIEARRLENEGKLNILVYKITDASYTPRFAMQLNHISDSNHVSRLKKVGSAGGFDVLVKRIKILLEKRAKGDPEKPLDVKIPELKGFSLPAKEYFVENSRDDLLKEIGDAFKKSQVVVLSGMFGFGKRSAIRKFAHDNGFAKVVEINGGNNTPLGFFSKSLEYLNVNDEAFVGTDDVDIARKKINFLAKFDADTLIIPTNVRMDGDKNDVAGLLNGLACKIAFITEDGAESYKDFYPVINVGRMNNDSLKKLFFHYYGEDTLEGSSVSWTLEKFFDKIGGHTKTVEIAASVLSREMLASPEELSKYLDADIEEKKILYDKIIDRLSSLICLEKFSDDEKLVLNIVALIADPQIDKDELLAVMKKCGSSQPSVITTLSDRKWINYDRLNAVVGIEPMIAGLVVEKILDDYSVAEKCFDYLKEKYGALENRHFLAAKYYMKKMEHLSEILGFDDAIMDVFRCFTIKFDRISEKKDKISKLLEELRERKDKDPAKEFELGIAEWLCKKFQMVAMIAPALLKSYKPGDNVDEIKECFNDIFIEATEKFEREDIDVEDEEVSAILFKIIMAVIAKSSTLLGEGIDDLIDCVSTMADDKIVDNAQVITNVISTSVSIADAYGSTTKAMEILKKAVFLDLPPDCKYNIIIMYVLRMMGNGDFDGILEILQSANELLEESRQRMSKIEYLNREKEYKILYAYALGMTNRADEAAEELLKVLKDAPYELCRIVCDTIDVVIDYYLKESRISDAKAFLGKTNDYLKKIATDANVDENIRKIAEDLILLDGYLDVAGKISVEQGGETDAESYYAKYSSEKKNGFFETSAYKSIAEKAKKYDFSGLSNHDFAEHTQQLRARAAKGESRKSLLPEAFALVSEAGSRVLGYRHNKMQHLGAAAMLDGKIVEILNGEGKTYTIALVAYVNSLYYDKTYVVDDSRYLTERNFKWMTGLFELLGVKSEYVASWRQWKTSEDCGIIYTTFDNLMFYVCKIEAIGSGKKIDFSSSAIVVDEADSILIDCSYPYSLYGLEREKDYFALCNKVFDIAAKIKDNSEYYEFDKNRLVLKEEIFAVIEDEFGVDSANANNFTLYDEVLNLLRIALKCFRWKRNVDYFVKGNGIYIERERDGQFVELRKEHTFFLRKINGLSIAESISDLSNMNLITSVIYPHALFGRFGAVSGASATASSFRKELKEVYDVGVFSVPPMSPVRRRDKTVALYLTKKFKDEDILKLIKKKHATHQPILLVTKNIGESLRYSRMLDMSGIKHSVLNAENSEQSPEMLANAGRYDGVLVTTAIANRGVDIKLGGDAEQMAVFELVEKGFDVSEPEKLLYRLVDENTKDSDLYKEYSLALFKNTAIVEREKKAVIEAGGLCVISTEAYSDMRIEQQIRGRSGRQGNVGESYFFVSAEDDLICHVFNERSFLKTLLNDCGTRILKSKIIDSSIERFKKQRHVATFGYIKEYALASDRTELAKEKINGVISGLGTDAEKTQKTLLKIWAQEKNMPDVLGFLIRETIGKKKPTEIKNDDEYAKLLDRFSDITTGERITAAENYIKNSINYALKDKIAEFVTVAESKKYLTMIFDSENDNANKEKGSVLKEKYDKEYKKFIECAVNRWLYLLRVPVKVK